MQPVLQALRDGATVVTSRPALTRHIHQHFAREQRRAGRRAWRSPDVVPWSAWLERCWEEAIADGVAGEMTLLQPAQCRDLWRDVVAEHADDLDTDAAADIARRSWELINAWDITVEQLRDAAYTADTRLFADWCERYRRRCRDNGWLDPAALPSRLALSGKPRVLLCGFEMLATRQRELCRRLGLDVVEPAPLADVGHVEAFHAADAAGESVAAARWIGAVRESEPEALTAVLIADSARDVMTVRRELLDGMDPHWQTLPAHRQQVEMDGLNSLASCCAVRTALLSLRLPFGTMSYDEFGELLRSPFLRGGRDEAPRRALLDIALRDRNERVVNVHKLIGDGALAELPLLDELLRTARDWAPQLGGRHAPGHWPVLITRFLADLGWCADDVAHDDVLQALQGWRRVLDQLAASGLVSEPVDFARARAYLQRAARDERLRAPAPQSPLRLMPLQQACGYSFDAVWIAGLSADNWPPPASPDALIPIDLQRRAGIPAADPSVFRHTAQRLLDDAVAGAGRIAVSWPQRSDEARQRPHALAIASADAATMTTAASGVTRRERQSAAAGAALVEQDAPPPLGESEDAQGGSRLFGLQAACPARAFFELRLGATEMPVPAFGIDARTRGLFMHTALQELYSVSGEPPAQLDTARRAARIEHAIDVAGRRWLRAADGLSALLAAQERQRAEALLSAWLDLESGRAAFEVDSVEGAEAVRVGPLEVRLRHDRIDRLADDALLVFDYKTARQFSMQGWWGARPAEPQLPLYAATSGADGIAVISLNENGVAVTGVARMETGLAGIVEPTRADCHCSWDQLLAQWRSALVKLADEYAAGDCRIDRKDSRLAAGEFAMLTRIGELS